MKAAVHVFACIAAMIFAVHTDAADEIRVSILSVLAPKEVIITILEPSTGFVRAGVGSGSREEAWPNHIPLRIYLRDGRLVWAEKDRAENGLEISCNAGCRFRLEVPDQIQREYRGKLRLSSDHNTINIVLYTSRIPLLGSIMISEMSGVEDPEALRSFAVLSRTFLLTSGRHPELQAEVCDTTHCQVYQGRPATGNMEQWVRSTEPLVLLYRSRAFTPYYSRNCGGRTSTHEEIWGRPSPDYPYSSVACPCGRDPLTWTYELNPESLTGITGLPGATITRTNSGPLEVRNSTRVLEFLPERFRILSGRIIGWDKIRSNRFEVEATPSGYRFLGTGNGHSAGFCQYGASLLAKRGYTFEQILLHYFPNAEIGEMFPATMWNP